MGKLWLVQTKTNYIHLLLFVQNINSYVSESTKDSEYKMETEKWQI